MNPRQIISFAIALLIIAPTLRSQTRPAGPKDLEAEMPADAHRLKIGDAAPMILLYLLSIGVVWLVHPKQRRKRREKREQQGQ